MNRRCESTAVWALLCAFALPASAWAQPAEYVQRQGPATLTFPAVKTDPVVEIPFATLELSIAVSADNVKLPDKLTRSEGWHVLAATQPAGGSPWRATFRLDPPGVPGPQ